MNLLDIACLPVHTAGAVLHHCVNRPRQHMFRFARPKWYCRVIRSKRTYHVIIGFVLMVGAAHVYHWGQHTGAPEFWELTAFGLHGFGAAPLIRIAADLIGMEV